MKKLAITLAFISLVIDLSAQQDMMMYNMHGVPQSSYANPSNRFDGRFFIGLPGISSNYFNYSNTVRYTDVIRKDGDSLLLSFDNLLKQMKDDNYMNISTRLDLASFGFNVSPSTQIVINFTEVFNMNIDYNKDMIKFIYEGNAAFLGTSPDLDGIGINASHYREYGLAVSHQLDEKWRLGMRFKYLYGMENVYTEKFDVKLVTDPETYALNAQTDMKIRTSGLEDPGDESFSSYFNGRGNRGYGVDLGANYLLNDKISLNASIVDLGFIKWNDFTKSYTSKGNYLYDGVDIDVFGEDTLDSGDSPFDQILDSIESELGVVEGTGAYTSPLITKIYLGGNYLINERSFAGVLIKNEIFNGKIKPSFSLSYGRKMTKWITLTGGYSSLNGSYDNISMGAVFDPGPVQFYVMTDNILGAFTPQNTRNLHIRFGINLIFGREKDEMKIFNTGSKKASTGSNPIESEEESTEEEQSEESDSEESNDSEQNTEESEVVNDEEGSDENSEDDSNSDESQEKSEESSQEDEKPSEEPKKDEATEDDNPE